LVWNIKLNETSAKYLIDTKINLLRKEGFKVSDSVKRDYCYEAIIESGKESVRLQVYFGKKGIKTVLQGNREGSIYIKVNSLLFGEQLFIPEEVKEPESYIGIDESGKGDYFGPLVIAGVFVDSGIKQLLLKAGVKDSKLLSDFQIKKISGEIKRISALKYNIVSINPEKYNQLYRKIGNVNKLLAWGHSRVLENLLSAVRTEYAVSDKFGSENYINESLMSEGKKINLIQITKGERFTGVAAASVLAREKFIEWFDNQEKKYKVRLPKGSSVQSLDTAKSLVSEFGEGHLEKFAKVHFKTTKKISIEKE